MRRQLRPRPGEQLDIADDLDAGVAGALGDRVAVEGKAGGDDDGVELGEVGLVEVGNFRSPAKAGVQGSGEPLRRSGLGSRPSPGSNLSSHAVTLAPLASSASTVASPLRASPRTA